MKKWITLLCVLLLAGCCCPVKTGTITVVTGIDSCDGDGCYKNGSLVNASIWMVNLSYLRDTGLIKQEKVEALELEEDLK